MTDCIGCGQASISSGGIGCVCNACPGCVSGGEGKRCFMHRPCKKCGRPIGMHVGCRECGAHQQSSDAKTIADLRERVRVLEEALEPLARASLSSSVGPVYVIGSRMGAPYDRNAAAAAVQRARAALAKGGE